MAAEDWLPSAWSRGPAGRGVGQGFVVAVTMVAGPVPAAVTAATVTVYDVPGLSPPITRNMPLAEGWVTRTSRPVTSIGARPSETVTR